MIVAATSFAVLLSAVAMGQSDQVMPRISIVQDSALSECQLVRTKVDRIISQDLNDQTQRVVLRILEVYHGNSQIGSLFEADVSNQRQWRHHFPQFFRKLEIDEEILWGIIENEDRRLIPFDPRRTELIEFPVVLFAVLPVAMSDKRSDITLRLFETIRQLSESTPRERPAQLVELCKSEHEELAGWAMSVLVRSDREAAIEFFQKLGALGGKNPMRPDVVRMFINHFDREAMIERQKWEVLSEMNDERDASVNP
jgi:hypothetical protein